MLGVNGPFQSDCIVRSSALNSHILKQSIFTCETILPRWRPEAVCDRWSYNAVVQSNFSIIHHFLPIPGRVLPALMEKGKIKHCLQWGLSSGPLDHHSNALLTVLGRYDDSGWQLNVDLAQLEEYWHGLDISLQKDLISLPSRTWYLPPAGLDISPPSRTWYLSAAGLDISLQQDLISPSNRTWYHPPAGLDISPQRDLISLCSRTWYLPPTGLDISLQQDLISPCSRTWYLPPAGLDISFL